MSLKYIIEFLLLKLLLLICKVLPTMTAIKFFNLLGKSLFFILIKRKKIALKNLDIAFPNKSKKEKIEIAKKSFSNLGEVLGYNLLIFSNKINESNFSKFISSKNIDDFSELINSCTSGILIISGHIGNWECLSHLISIHAKRPFNVIAREMNNPMIDNKIIKPIRNKFNIKIFPKKNALLKMVKVLKKREIAGILIDQNLNEKVHIKTQFFKKNTKCTPLPAVLHTKYNTPVIFAYLIKNDNGKYQLFFDNLKFNNVDYNQNDINVYITALHQNLLEKVIKKYPSQWFWMHNRWDFNSL